MSARKCAEEQVSEIDGPGGCPGAAGSSCRWLYVPWKVPRKLVRGTALDVSVWAPAAILTRTKPLEPAPVFGMDTSTCVLFWLTGVAGVPLVHVWTSTQPTSTEFPESGNSPSTAS